MQVQAIAWETITSSLQILIMQMKFQPYLQAREKLVGILVLPYINGLTIVVLEGAPEAHWAVVFLVAECQVCKHHLSRTIL